MGWSNGGVWLSDKGGWVKPVTASGPLLDALSVSASVAYSTRKLRAAYAGSAIKVRRSSDNTTQDIGFTGNNLDTASLATFVGANSAFIDTWYDQSGNAINATMATTGNQPRIVNSGTNDTLNSNPAIRFGISAATNLKFTTTLAQSDTIALVVKDNSHVPNGHYTDGSTGSPRQLVGELSGAYALYAGSAAPTGGTTDLLAHSLLAFFASLSVGVLNVDGTGTINSTVGSDGIATQVIGAGNGGTTDTAMDGWLPEYIVFPSILGASDTALIGASHRAYWGTV